MLNLKQILAATAVVVLGTVITGNVIAQDAAALVEKRQDQMKQMGKAFGSVMPIVKGENPNVADAVPSATTYSTLSKQIIENFPAGTGRDAVPETRAKPEVWSQRAEFEAAANKLAEESDKLLEAAKSNDIDMFRTQFKVFGKACGGCHEGPPKKGGKFRFAKE